MIIKQNNCLEMAFAQLRRPKQKMDTEVKIMLIKKFEQLQQERRQAFKLLEEAHKMYLAEKPAYEFAQYQKVVADITQDFKRVKQEVRAIIGQFCKQDDTATTTQRHIRQQRSGTAEPSVQCPKITKLDEQIADCEKQLAALCINLAT
ncbi:hypothetical protein B566_EDAN008306 [Ephemera danica]|nr:hypothetical protein B566_EDAN008306 [Ephemera danica]